MDNTHFISIVEASYPEDSDRIKKALGFASQKHMGQVRDSGEEYITHPVAVAEILMGLSADADTVVSGLLHDCLENTDCTEKEIESGFGKNVQSLLVGLMKINNIKRAYYKEGANPEALQKMLLAMGADSRIALIKLAERLHNMRTLEFKTREKQIRTARETLDVYVPLCERLGLGLFKHEMEDLCFKFLYPADYASVVATMEKEYKESKAIIEDITRTIEKLAQKHGIKARIQSREKSAYSLFQKWVKKGKDNVFDIIAHRIIVSTVPECYTMLGEVNNTFKPLDGRIKDYIAHPKPNLYMSLHTTVLYPVKDSQPIPFEIQIRTEEMHSFCEYGVAAHWIYKDRGVKAISGDTKKLRTSLISGQPQENLQQKQEFYEDKIFVFTPNLDVIELPKDAIAIDFAYAVHSSVGNKCVGAKVNGKMVTLTTPLKTGDVVEVITSATSKGPSRDWIKLVKSPSTVSKIRAFFKRERKDENLRLGREMLEEFAKRNGTNLSTLLDDKESLSYVMERYNLASLDDIFATVGYGGLTASQVLSKFLAVAPAEKKHISEARPSKHNDSVMIGGHKDLLKKFAKCCCPIPGDEIIGYVSRGKGVTIHRKDCPYLLYLEDDRKINTEWSEDSQNSFYDATLAVVAEKSPSTISTISSKIAENKIMVNSIVLEKSGADAHYLVNVKINTRKQLYELINKLRASRSIYDCYRP